MRLTIASVGRLKAGPERTLCERYQTRFAALARSIGVDAPRMIEFVESPLRRVEERQQDEMKSFASCFDAQTFVIILDERGKNLTSPEFAKVIELERERGRGHLAVLIGGPDGFDPELRARASLVLSFGAMTIPHQLVKVLLMEQLYRATTILNNHPYHRV